MEAKNFRMGNWVYDESADGTKYLTRVGIDQMEYPHNCQPVELNEKRLLDFGFEDGCKHIDKNPYWCAFWCCYNGETFTCFLDEKIEIANIHYVHELQNLFFAIEGKELELKTDA